MCYVYYIPLRPRPYKKPRVTRWGTYDPSKKDKLAVVKALQDIAPFLPTEQAVSVLIIFHVPIPTATPKAIREQMLRGHIFPTKRPDLDNLAYLVNNAMSELIYKDDSQIIHESQMKMYAEEPGITIIVSKMTTKILNKVIYAVEKRKKSCNCL